MALYCLAVNFILEKARQMLSKDLFLSVVKLILFWDLSKRTLWGTSYYGRLSFFKLYEF